MIHTLFSEQNIIISIILAFSLISATALLSDTRLFGVPETIKRDGQPDRTSWKPIEWRIKLCFFLAITLLIATSVGMMYYDPINRAIARGYAYSPCEHSRGELQEINQFTPRMFTGELEPGDIVLLSTYGDPVIRAFVENIGFDINQFATERRFVWRTNTRREKMHQRYQFIPIESQLGQELYQTYQPEMLPALIVIGGKQTFPLIDSNRIPIESNLENARNYGPIVQNKIEYKMERTRLDEFYSTPIPE